MGRRVPDENLTLRVDPDVVLWARMRALRSGTSVNRIIRQG
jgi:predicted HicB family RNase H-like nuclease